MDDTKPYELPIKPSMCIGCFRLYIRTQGEEQESCLICQRFEFKKLMALIERQQKDQRKEKVVMLGKWGDIILTE